MSAIHLPIGDCDTCGHELTESSGRECSSPGCRQQICTRCAHVDDGGELICDRCHDMRRNVLDQSTPMPDAAEGAVL